MWHYVGIINTADCFLVVWELYVAVISYGYYQYGWLHCHCVWIINVAVTLYGIINTAGCYVIGWEWSMWLVGLSLCGNYQCGWMVWLFCREVDDTLLPHDGCGCCYYYYLVKPVLLHNDLFSLLHYCVVYPHVYHTVSLIDPTSIFFLASLSR